MTTTQRLATLERIAADICARANNAPPRLPAVQRVIDGLFGEMLGDHPVDRAAARRVMRAASPEDRRFIAHLLGWRESCRNRG